MSFIYAKIKNMNKIILFIGLTILCLISSCKEDEGVFDIVLNSNSGSTESIFNSGSNANLEGIQNYYRLNNIEVSLNTKREEMCIKFMPYNGNLSEVLQNVNLSLTTPSDVSMYDIIEVKAPYTISKGNYISNFKFNAHGVDYECGVIYYPLPSKQCKIYVRSCKYENLHNWDGNYNTFCKNIFRVETDASLDDSITNLFDSYSDLFDLLFNAPCFNGREFTIFLSGNNSANDIFDNIASLIQFLKSGCVQFYTNIEVATHYYDYVVNYAPGIRYFPITDSQCQLYFNFMYLSKLFAAYNNNTVYYPADLGGYQNAIVSLAKALSDDLSSGISLYKKRIKENNKQATYMYFDSDISVKILKTILSGFETPEVRSKLTEYISANANAPLTNEEIEKALISLSDFLNTNPSIRFGVVLSKFNPTFVN